MLLAVRAWEEYFSSGSSCIMIFIPYSNAVTLNNVL